jgi:AcrR family transcriptional regulator
MQILDAAWRCFYRAGLHETTMQDIIREADLSAGAVYLYFPSKEEIIMAAIGNSLTGVRAILSELLEKDGYHSLAHMLEELAAAIDHFAGRDGYDLRSIALLGWSEAQTNARIREAMVPVYQEFLSQLRRAVKRGQKRNIVDRSVSADAAATLFLSLLLGNVVQSALLRNNPTRKLAKGVAGLVPITHANRSELPISISTKTDRASRSSEKHITKPRKRR